MTHINKSKKEINSKILLIGGQKCGKKTTLQAIFSQTTPEINNPKITLTKDNTKSPFKFLPISSGFIKDYHLKIHLYTLPTSNVYESTLSMLTENLDGIIYLIDSQIDSLINNEEYIKTVKNKLAKRSIDIDSLVQVFQYNKRDLKNTIPTHLLHKHFNSKNHPEIETVATKGIGTLEIIEKISHQLSKNISPLLN